MTPAFTPVERMTIGFPLVRNPSSDLFDFCYAGYGLMRVYPGKIEPLSGNFGGHLIPGRKLPAPFWPNAFWDDAGPASMNDRSSPPDQAFLSWDESA